MTKYLDLEGLSLTNPTEQYARAVGCEWDAVGVPLEALRAGDSIITGPWSAWEWLPEYVTIEAVPDGGDYSKREASALVHALRVRGLPPALARKAPTPRARAYEAYVDACRWVTEVADRVPHQAPRIEVGASDAPHRVLHTMADVLQVYRELRVRPFAWDLETTGLDPRTSSVVGCALAHNDMAYWVPEGLFHHSAPAFVDLLQSVPHAYGSNLKFDMSMLAVQYGLVPTQCLPWDTQVMHFCVARETRVLTEGFEWKPIGDIKVGERLVGVEEVPQPGFNRKFESAEVLAKTVSVRADTLRLRFASGREVVCTPEHKWLLSHPHKSRRNSGRDWITAAELQHMLNRKQRRRPVRIRYALDPWERKTSFEAGWLSGFFDGEGWVTMQGTPTVGVAQNEGVVLDYAKELLHAEGYTFATRDRIKCRRLILRGRDQALRFLGEFAPKRLIQKFIEREYWWGMTVRSKASLDDELIAIEDAGAREVVDITTTSHTFLAEGFISHNCLDPGAFQHGLKYLAKTELGRDPLEFKDVTSAYKNFREVPADLAARYAAAGDARNSYDLVERFKRDLSARGLLDVYTQLEQPVTSVLTEMELAGLSLNRHTLFNIASNFADRSELIKCELRELGFDGNPNADAQVARFLYEQLGLPTLVTTAKTGRGSVALPVLRKLLLLRGSHEGVARWARAVELFMEWSDVDKNLSTFLVPWLVSHVRTVYAELKQTRVVTGRLASEPNIQNWPARVRAMVVAPGEGWLCSADYAQGEPRLAAHYSQDARMLDDFRSGRDVYVSLGVDMGFALADLGKHSQLRQNIKTTFLAWQYMTSPPKIQEIALRQGTVLPLSEARVISDGLTHARPQFVAWRAGLIADARRNGGVVRDLFGRERWVRGLNAVDPGARNAAEREVSNFPAQAGLGGIIKGSMLAVQRLYRQAGGSLINQIHDELVGWVPEMSERTREDFAHAVGQAMLWKTLSVPMETEVGYGRSWSEAKDGEGGAFTIRR
jgi:DNA polymerase I-like protein with 3'-5' exonuclease and polymerase domains